MAKPFLLSLSLCLLLFTSACLGNRSNRFNECQHDSINALEPDYRIESEAGVTETWNSNHPELRCVGVTLVKRTIDPDGLHLPSYVNYPQLIMILQGEGVLGISVPGCPETYEEPQSQSRQGHRKGSSHSQQQQQQDSHQKIRHFRQVNLSPFILKIEFLFIQMIMDLSSIVKELVKNSDATSIEIALKDFDEE